MGDVCFYQGMSITNKRKTNMDCLLMAEQMIENKSVSMFVVCDGVGGTRGGGEAATFCVHFLDEWFYQLTSINRLALNLQECVVEMNVALCSYLEEQQLMGATTLSVLLLERGNFYIIHLGDSRIYGVNKNNILQLTEDQTDEQGRLSGYLGKKQVLPIFYTEGKNEYHQFLLCSDGLYRKTDWDLLRHKITKKNIKDILEKMVECAVESGETDNISGILIQKDKKKGE